LPDWLIGSIESLNGGARLQPQTRQALLAEAKSRIDAYKQSVDTDVQNYTSLAQRYGINPADIIPRFPSALALPQTNISTPNGVDPEVWKYMTPEERALWK
jgi:hypothetical protein